MPGVHRIIEITYPEAEELADLYGIQLDLRRAKTLCNHALSLPDMGSVHYEIVDGLVVAALTTYMRCFASGLRLGLKEADMTAFSPEQKEAHDFFKNLRDLHVAHPINPLEETYVTATASEVDGKLRPIESLNPGRETITLSADDAEIIQGLSEAMELSIQPRIEAAEAKLLTFLQSLPVEDVHSLDLHSARRGRSEQYVSRHRKQKKRSNK